MEKFVIEGRHVLNGSVTPSGSKNEVLPCIAATLLTDEPVVLSNVPYIRDVLVMLEVLERQGATVEWLSSPPSAGLPTGETRPFGTPNRVRICNAGVKGHVLDAELCRKVRASILFAGPMVARMGRVVLPPPGGDVIGRRRLDTHFHAFESLGATVDVSDLYDIQAAELVGADIFMDEASVTATENALTVAALAKGTTILRNCASEPHVCALARMLVAMGAHIDGIGTNTLRIEGVARLGGTEHEVESDYLEIGSLIGLAAVTRSELTIHKVVPANLRMIRMVFERLGVLTRIEGNRLVVPGDQPMEIRPDYHNQVPKIDDAPWPAFPTDLMSVAITTSTQCRGTVLFFEKMFEGRMFFIDLLQGMGAQIILCDPHRVVVVGPQTLKGTRVQSPDIRAGMAMLIAGLCAEGRTEIFNVHQIDRGYEGMDEKLRQLGAHIQRVPVE